ncbi:ankyrin repeat domain-containing protein [Microbacterium sp. ZW T5_45]|uniref:ankyrin repeat domain-containing protein n=1 Tax=Microbacterium sp. ZW T5_45 TaxID=3378080 RepID=UPI0038554266
MTDTDAGELYRATNARDLHEVRRLLRIGADPSVAPLRNGWTPLHLAAQHADLAIARELISAGAPVDRRDAVGRTAAFVAVLAPSGAHDVLTALLDAGADPTIVNDHGESAASVAAIIAGFPADLLGRLQSARTSDISGVVTLCCLLWARDGLQAEMAAYEDDVIELLADHGATILQRAVSDGAEGAPHEVQLYRFDDRAGLDGFLADPRRTALAEERDRVVARTELFPVKL